MLSWLNFLGPPVNEIVRQFNQQGAIAPTTPVNSLKFLVIDLETTGLDAKKDYIVSIGWLPVIQLEIQLDKAEHHLIKSPVSVGQSAVFHGLHDRDLNRGRDLAEVLEILLAQYQGYIFVAHHAQIEQQFLQIATRRCFGSPIQLKFIDTMQIEWQRFVKRNQQFNHKALQLNACLARHGLPVGQQHHALADAFSCALLLLSQVKQSRDVDMTLEQLQKLSVNKL